MIVLCIFYKEIVLSIKVIIFYFIYKTRFVSFKKIKSCCEASASYLLVALFNSVLKFRAIRRLVLWRYGILYLLAGTERSSCAKPRFVMKILYWLSCSPVILGMIKSKFWSVINSRFAIHYDLNLNRPDPYF